ncbi:MAG: AMP-binding protein [Planctomycetota bacterium]|jgi:long-chain acyl-CoA synthetase
MRVLQPILRRLLQRPFRTVAVDDQRPWKAAAVYAGALHVARAVERAGSRPTVGLMLPTSGLFPMSLLGVWMLGGTAVPLNYLLKRDDLEYVIEDAGLETIITVGPMIEHFGELPASVRQIRLDEMSFGGLPPIRRAARRDDDHLAVLMYTSGTSGRPKGVMLTSGNLAANVDQCRRWVGFDESHVLLGVLPQFHSFGLTVLTLLPLTVGSRVAYTARFMPKRMLDLMKKHRPTALIAIPSMYGALLAAKSAKAEHFESIKYLVSGGEPLPEAVFDGFRERFGVTINEGYGLTETGPVTNWCRPDEFRRRSVGRPLPDIIETIKGSDGQVLDAGQEGEICIKGPNVMPGYYHLPDETAAVFDDEGFFRTGDMGRMDEDGHLYITGRIKEMLIIGGENVFPREIEEVLNKHASVAASAVIGMHDPSRGEVALAFVELADGATFDETALRSHCRESLAQYKVPRDIRVLEQLPRNPTGKILRRELSAETPSIANDASA